MSKTLVGNSFPHIHEYESLPFGKCVWCGLRLGECSVCHFNHGNDECPTLGDVYD